MDGSPVYHRAHTEKERHSTTQAVFITSRSLDELQAVIITFVTVGFVKLQLSFFLSPYSLSPLC